MNPCIDRSDSFFYYTSYCEMHLFDLVLGIALLVGLAIITCILIYAIWCFIASAVEEGVRNSKKK